jgi:hypothetical protein
MMTDFNSMSFLLERRHGAHGVRAWLGTSSKRDLDDYCEFLSTLVHLCPPGPHTEDPFSLS